MLSRVFFRRQFASLSLETERKVFGAVQAYKDERSREIFGDLQAKGDSVSEEEKLRTTEQLRLLSAQVTGSSQWKDFGFDGLDEVECLLTIEDAVGIRVPDEDFHAVHGMEAALKIVEKYAPTEGSATK
jgi:acyl carrier protein